MSFKDEFESFYKSNLGDISLPYPLFYKFPVGIRFEMGDDNEDDDDRYIKGAKSRALSIFNELFDKDDEVYLVIDSYEKYSDFYSAKPPKDNISLVRKFISKTDEEYCYEKLVATYEDDEEEYPYSRYIIKTSRDSIDADKLISEIVESELKGKSSLSNSVFFVNKNSGILYFLYDDRGLDIAANDKQKLKDIYIKFNDWILDYHRERIYKMFSE